MTAAAIADDLLVAQDQVQRLMNMRRHFRAQKPPPPPEFWMHWQGAMDAQLEQVGLVQSFLTTLRAANDPASKGDAA